MKRSLIITLALFASPICAETLRFDHKLHILAGSATYAGSRIMGVSPMKSVGVCALMGVAKEVYDSTGRGQVEASDLAATIVPCVLAAIVETMVVKKHTTKPTRISDSDRRSLVNFGKKGF